MGNCIRTLLIGLGIDTTVPKISMEGERNEVMTSVSSVLSMLEEQRRVAYSRSSIELVSAVENKYPLADIIMERYVV